MPCIARLQSFRWKQRLQLLQLLFLQVPKQHQRLCCLELGRRGSTGGHQAVPGARKQLLDGIKKGKTMENLQETMFFYVFFWVVLDVLYIILHPKHIYYRGCWFLDALLQPSLDGYGHQEFGKASFLGRSW